MITNLRYVLDRNFQRVTDNRFVVDSDRFWREEFHPRFKDLFTYEEIKDIVELAHSVVVSYKLKDEYIDGFSIKLFEWFSGYRFVEIPTKNPNAPQMFLSDLYFTLLDVLPGISFEHFPLIDDDFNIVTHRAETDKEDTTKLATEENMRQGSAEETKHDILSEGLLSQVDSASTENIDNEGWQNNKTVGDVFLSPQNQGVKPTTVNTEFDGVNGITMPNESAYTTNTTKQVFGESTKDQSNTSAQGQQSTETLTQNNDVRTTQNSDTDLNMGQSHEQGTKKRDYYDETLAFHRGARLQEFYNLTDVRLWNEILARLSRWILQVTIATADTNYLDCERYD